MPVSAGDLEVRALRIAELAGELVAAAESGAEIAQRRETLAELRRQLEALDAEALSLSVHLQ